MRSLLSLPTDIWGHYLLPRLDIEDLSDRTVLFHLSSTCRALRRELGPLLFRTVDFSLPRFIDISNGLSRRDLLAQCINKVDAITASHLACWVHVFRLRCPLNNHDKSVQQTRFASLRSPEGRARNRVSLYWQTRLQDYVLDAVSALPNLRELSFYEMHLSEQHTAKIMSLEQLDCLYIHQCSVEGDAFASFPSRLRLRHLAVSTLRSSAQGFTSSFEPLPVQLFTAALGSRTQTLYMSSMYAEPIFRALSTCGAHSLRVVHIDNLLDVSDPLSEISRQCPSVRSLTIWRRSTPDEQYFPLVPGSLASLRTFDGRILLDVQRVVRVANLEALAWAWDATGAMNSFLREPQDGHTGLANIRSISVRNLQASYLPQIFSAICRHCPLLRNIHFSRMQVQRLQSTKKDNEGLGALEPIAEAVRTLASHSPVQSISFSLSNMAWTVSEHVLVETFVSVLEHFSGRHVLHFLSIDGLIVPNARRSSARDDMLSVGARIFFDQTVHGPLHVH